MNLVNLTKNSAFICSSAAHNSARALDYFIGLIENCGIAVESGSELPEQSFRKNYNLFFIDLTDCKWGKAIPNDIKQLAEQAKVVLFNGKEGELSEKTAIFAGINGIFYTQDQPDIMLKGLIRLQNNERWFKRKAMDDVLADLLGSLKSNRLAHPPQTNNIDFSVLTKRENTIINLVTVGAQNKEIADQLNISTNTVKTHIYSIFRKTQSRNRVELISWSLRYQASCI